MKRVNISGRPVEGRFSFPLGVAMNTPVMRSGAQVGKIVNDELRIDDTDMLDEWNRTGKLSLRLVKDAVEVIETS